MKAKSNIRSLLPFFIGLGITIILLLAIAPQPAAAAADFLAGSFTIPYYAGSVFNTALLLIVSALGAGCALTIGECNLGGEGQIYAGGFTAAIVLVRCAALPPAISLLLAGTSAAVVAALLALISAALKQLKNASVLLTSFLVSSAVIPFIDALIAGKFRGHTGNLLATPFIPENVRFAQIAPPSPLSAAVLIVPIVCCAAWYIRNRTTAGARLRIMGTAPEFAAYCGYPRVRMVYEMLGASGALHGLTGFLAVCGTYYTCHSGFSSGMGWNALSCALIAASDPLALIPSGLLLSWLYTSASRVALNQNFGFDINSLIQGIILFSVSIHSLTTSRSAS